jgi:hypothetical protein
LKFLTTLMSHFIVSRVLVDKSQLPLEHYDLLRPHLDEMRSWSNVFTDLKVNEPTTWVLTTQRLIERVASQSRSPDLDLQESHTVNDLWSLAMEKLDYMELDSGWFLTDLIWDAVESCPSKVILKDTDHVYTKIDISDKFSVFRRKAIPKPYKSLDGKEEPPPVVDVKYKGSKYHSGVLFVPDAHTPKWFEFLKACGDILFKSRSLYALDYNSKKSELRINPFSFPDRDYKGEALELIEEWKMYMDKQIRRCVCLQGDPGTGKSTLSRTVVKVMQKRALRVSPKAFRRANFNAWKNMLTLINPDILILDDIDRIHELEDYLERFEDSYYTVPLTIFTSNHLDRIPKAFLRPGRIDQLVRLDDPSPEVQLDVLKDFAKREGVSEIPLNKVPFMALLYKEYSGAYAVEYLRRISVFGWDYRIPLTDLTFEKLVGKEDELNPDINPDVECLLYSKALKELELEKPAPPLVASPDRCEDGSLN